MKLQRFIENYRKDKCQKTLSPERSTVFKTSESIGTLNSRDQSATDRSFAIKDIHSHTQYSTHKPQNIQQVQYLRQLYESQRRQQNNKKYDKQILSSIQQFKYQTSNEHLVATFSKKNKQIFIKPNFSFHPQQIQQPNNLYEQQPSSQYNKQQNKQQNKIQSILSNQQYKFIQFYNTLLIKIQKLQQQNILYQQQWIKQQKINIEYQQSIKILQSEINILKQKVTNIIQQNIEVENMIKEVLLKQQMQKYRYFSQEQSHHKKINHISKYQHH